MNDELTYKEHLSGKIKNLKIELNLIVRNIVLTTSDLDKNGYFTESFYLKNKDSIKIEKIKSIEKELKVLESKINKIN